jgi:hypothetical protein
MTTNAIFDAASSLELDSIQGRSVCISCHERSSLRTVVAELLYENQLLRFQLSQSQALVGQLRLAFDQMQIHPGSTTELEVALNLLSAF